MGPYRNMAVSNKKRAIRSYWPIILFLVVLVLPGISPAFSLRQTAEILLPEGHSIYGCKSGNLVIGLPNKLTFYDKHWKVRGEVEMDSSQTAFVSSNGLFYGIVEDSYKSEPDSSVRIVSIYDNHQLPRWAVYDAAHGEYYLSPSGDYFIAVVVTGPSLEYQVVVYNQSHPAVQQKIGFFEEILFSDDGRYFIIDSGTKGVRLFDAGGRILEEFGSQRLYSFSENSDLLALFGGTTLGIWSNGKQRLAVDFKATLLNGLVLRKNSERAVMAFHDKLVVADLKSGKSLWETSPSKSGGTFTTVDVSPDSRFIACGVDINRGPLVDGPKRHITGFLYVYDSDGQTVQMLEFRYERYKTGLPRVFFADDNRTILVENRESLHIIEMY
jgi:hypothetical protein